MFFAYLILCLALPIAVMAELKEFSIYLASSLIAPDGAYREAFLVNGTDPGPPIIVDEGDTIKLLVINNLPIPITVHFHGVNQAGTPWYDGVSGISQSPIRPAESFTYEFTTEGQYGMFWYHAHHRTYYQDGVRGAVYIRPNSSHPRPYSEITSDPDELAEIMELEQNPTFFVHNEWYKWSSEYIIDRQVQYNVDPTCTQSILINGKGRIVCNKNETVFSVSGPIRQAASMALLGAPPVYDSMGCWNLASATTPNIDNAGVESPGFSAECVPTYTDREIFYANSTWKMFAIYNTGAEITTSLAIDGHDMYVVAVEGQFIKPQKIKQLYMPLATRFLVLVKTDKSSGIYAMRVASQIAPQIIESIAFLSYETPEATGQPEDHPNPEDVYQDLGGLLTNATYATFNTTAATPYDTSITVPTGPADKTINLFAQGLTLTTYTLLRNKQRMDPAMEYAWPVLFQTGNLSLIPTVLDLGIKQGDVVDIILQNTPVAGIPHPMHFHGHSFHVISDNPLEPLPYPTVAAAEANGTVFNYAGAPFRDTYELGPAGHVVLRYIANNPGAWMFHCHINAHQYGGMAVTILENVGLAQAAMKKAGVEYLMHAY
ncbi:multicopper oxidase-domain-containing protein [Lipomyces arxii]|uniref:multicopper oxidase-domain-containing protein n=1 Tax=Lipomyces arxii TaxID=56418 RepID=UPI0034CDF6F5